VRESPTEIGMVGSCGPTPPDSKKTTRSGALVRWASIAAAHGAPVPTATVRPFSSMRAAQQIISSMGLYMWSWSPVRLFNDSKTDWLFGEPGVRRNILHNRVVWSITLALEFETLNPCLKGADAFL